MRRHGGFTLLEVLIALTLLSLMMVGVVAAMRTFGNTKVALESVTGRVDEIRVVSDFLRGSIGGALPVLRIGTAKTDDRFEGSSGDTYFAGDSSGVMWVAPLVAGANAGGAYVMQLSRSGERLELKWRPYQRNYADFEAATVEPRILLDSVEEFSIGYRASHNGKWLEAWPGQRFNPVAVRLNIRASGRYWPELVIALNGDAVHAL